MDKRAYFEAGLDTEGLDIAGLTVEPWPLELALLVNKNIVILSLVWV